MSVFRSGSKNGWAINTSYSFPSNYCSPAAIGEDRYWSAWKSCYYDWWSVEIYRSARYSCTSLLKFDTICFQFYPRPIGVECFQDPLDSDETRRIQEKLAWISSCFQHNNLKDIKNQSEEWWGVRRIGCKRTWGYLQVVESFSQSLLTAGPSSGHWTNSVICYVLCVQRMATLHLCDNGAAEKRIVLGY